MLWPLETMLLLFGISYTFVLDARVLSMNKSCTIWIAHSNYCLTIVKLVLNFRLIVCEERKDMGKAFGLLRRLNKEQSVAELLENQSSTEFNKVGKGKTEIKGIPLWPIMSF